MGKFMFKNNDFTKLLKPYHKKWVAISPNGEKVVGSGKTPKEALKQAKTEGFDEPILTLASNNYAYTIT